MRVLITGATGFAGSHLIDYILELGGHEVAGFKRPRSSMSNVEHCIDKIKWFDVDLTDTTGVRSAIAKWKPERIFHLGAISYVPTSWENPNSVIDVNVKGTINVLEAVRAEVPKAKVQLACSSEEYGKVLSSELPIKETNPFRPLSQYGVSKVAEDLLGYQYTESYNLHIIRTRGFNHSGSRRGPDFVLSTFARQLIKIKQGKQEKIKVGNLEAIRDFTDVRDMVRAYWVALQSSIVPGAYNVATGRGWCIKEALNILCDLVELDINQVVEEDPNRMRPSDVPVLIGDATRFKTLTGWEPEYDFLHLLNSLVAYWKDQLK